MFKLKDPDTVELIRTAVSVVLIATYLLGVIMAFGHAWRHCGKTFDERVVGALPERDLCYLLGVPTASVLWPLYVSARIWEGQ